MVATILKYALAGAIGWLVSQFALQFLPGVLAQQRRTDPRGRLISAAHAVRPEALPPLDGMVLLTGAQFTSETLSGLPHCPDNLGGVSVWIGDQPQPIRFVSPGAVIVVPTLLTSWLVVVAQDGRVYYAPVRMAAMLTRSTCLSAAVWRARTTIPSSIPSSFFL